MKSQQKKATKMVNLCENHLFRLKARKKRKKDAEE
jgi:hypothetical protein